VKALGLEPRTYGLKVREGIDTSNDPIDTSGERPDAVAGRLLDAVSKSPDLAKLVEIWSELPEPVRRAILTLAVGCS